MSSPATADVVIVGGGIISASTAYALAQRGITDVSIYERDTVGAGGTGKSSSIVRCHYGVKSLAALAAKSLTTFENAESIFGMDIGFRQTGYVVGVGPDNIDALRANLADQQAVGVETREIDHAQVAEMWPVAYLDDFAAFGYEPRGGYADAYQTAQAFAVTARTAGVRLHQSAAVKAIRVQDNKLRGVTLADGTEVSAPTVVIAASLWSSPLLAACGIDVPLRTHRGQVILVEPGVDAADRVRDVPVLSDLVSLQYIRAEIDDKILVGNSDLAVLEPADPDNYFNGATPEYLDRAVTKLAHRLPGMPNASVSSSYAGCYDITPDFNPVITRAASIEGLILAVGFSGHGFKIAPAVGELVADLVQYERSTDPNICERDFRLERFAEGDLLTSAHPYTGASQMR
ncbi:FAD-binding oxidoreductase [Mycobacterium sp. 141]|uniref:NAD(P)/FAD-dependent oxidoreductase n=1 Tax=Mycobacterium sp. 141 TaxID=1120797 RepID=UPI00037D8EA4|nr:FAD-dependent oxidoreductase [Mycobacterium sp. 141]